MKEKKKVSVLSSKYKKESREKKDFLLNHFQIFPDRLFFLTIGKNAIAKDFNNGFLPLKTQATDLATNG